MSKPTHPHKVTFRATETMVAALDDLAQREGARLGLNLQRSDVLRRAVAQAIATASSGPIDSPHSLAMADMPSIRA